MNKLNPLALVALSVLFLAATEGQASPRMPMVLTPISSPDFPVGSVFVDAAGKQCSQRYEEEISGYEKKTLIFSLLDCPEAGTFRRYECTSRVCYDKASGWRLDIYGVDSWERHFRVTIKEGFYDEQVDHEYILKSTPFSDEANAKCHAFRGNIEKLGISVTFNLLASNEADAGDVKRGTLKLRLFPNGYRPAIRDTCGLMNKIQINNGPLKVVSKEAHFEGQIWLLNPIVISQDSKDASGETWSVDPNLLPLQVHQAHAKTINQFVANLGLDHFLWTTGHDNYYGDLFPPQVFATQSQASEGMHLIGTANDPEGKNYRLMLSDSPQILFPIP